MCRTTSATAAPRASATAPRKRPKAIGWEFRLLDGQGAPSTRASALTQAIALQPAGIILGTIDAREQAPLIEQAVAQGIKVVGWHSGGAPGPIEGVPGVITNITTDPLEVAKASGLYAVVDSGGKAGVIIFTDSIYAIAIAKSDATAEAVKNCSGCKVLETVDTPIGDLQNRMGQLTTSLLSKYGADWTYSVAVNDLYYDFSAPSLTSAGIDPAEGYPRQISAGDGSVPAFQRIRDGQYQVATVAEPLYPARLADHRRAEPRLRRRSAERLRRRRRTSSSQANIDKDGGDTEHLRSGQRLPGPVQEDLGRSVDPESNRE